MDVSTLKGYWDISLNESLSNIIDSKAIQFIDVKAIYSSYVGFERSVFNELLENFNRFENYRTKNIINEIKSPEGENLSNEPILMLVGLDKNDLRFGVLLYLSDEDVVILGLWPEQFFNAVKNDENVLVGALVAFIKAPGNWKVVHLGAPMKLEIN